MSINRSIGPQISFWEGEMAIQEHTNIQMVLKKNSHSNEHLKGTKAGKIYLTNYRLIFRTKNTNDMMQELSMPFKQIKDFEIKQPVFGANFLTAKLLAEPNGGWEGSVVFEITFKDGGAIELGQKLIDIASKPLRPMYMQSTIHFAQTYPPQHPGGYVDQHYHHQTSPGQPPMYAGHHPPPPPAYNGAPPPNMQQGSTLPPQYDPTQQPPAYK